MTTLLVIMLLSFVSSLFASSVAVSARYDSKVIMDDSAPSMDDWSEAAWSAPDAGSDMPMRHVSIPLTPSYLSNVFAQGVSYDPVSYQWDGQRKDETSEQADECEPDDVAISIRLI